MTELNSIQKKILETLLEYNRFLTTTEASKKSGVSWNTAKAYLEDFFSKGWIEHKKNGNRDLWKANSPK